ncbi:MAG: hypothetical protein ACREX9_11360, partial [Gammaproteobacteria bacterium]
THRESRRGSSRDQGTHRGGAPTPRLRSPPLARFEKPFVKLGLGTASLRAPVVALDLIGS